MERKTLITIHHLSLSLLIMVGYHNYIDKANNKFKKERDTILNKMRNYNKEN
jgi:hypothetical protein